MVSVFIPSMESHVGLKKNCKQNLFYISRVTSTCYNTNQKTRLAMADAINTSMSALKGKDCGPWLVQRNII